MRLSGSHTQSVMAQVHEIPRDRMVGKVWRSLLGLLFIGGAVLMAWKLSVPWYVYIPVAVFGAHITSAELTQAAAKFIVAAVKDTLGAVRGKSDGTPPVA